MNFFTHLSSEFSVNLMITLGHSLWQGLVIAGIAAGIAWMIRPRDAKLRYAIYLCAMVLTVACLPITYAVVEQTRGEQSWSGSEIWPTVAANQTNVNNASDNVFGGEQIEISSAQPIVLQEEAMTGDITTHNNAAESRGEFWALWLSRLYLIGILLMFMRLTFSLFSAQHLCKDAIAVESPSILKSLEKLVRDLGLRVSPALVLSRRIVTPTVVGVIRPTILLPFSLVSTLSPDEISAILAHELAHIRRYDLWVNLFQRFVESLLFFHPAVWFLSRRLSTEREFCCDNFAISQGLGSIKYAELLVRLAEARCYLPSDTEQQVALAATGDRPSQLRQRVAHIFGLQQKEELTMSVSRRGVMTFVASLILAGLFFSVSLPAKSPTETLADNSETTNVEVDSDSPTTTDSKTTDTTNNASAVLDTTPKTARPNHLSELSEVEQKIVGTWVSSSFLVSTTMTYKPDRSFRTKYLQLKGEPYVGTWGVEKGTQLVFTFASPEADDETIQTSRHQILSLDEKELKFQQISPNPSAKAITYTRLTENGSDIKREKAEQKPKPLELKAPIPLGKVVERTVNDDNPKHGNFLIDFETGKIFSPPVGLLKGEREKQKKIFEWITDNGIDAVGESKSSVKGLFGFNMVAIPISSPKDKLPEISAARIAKHLMGSIPGTPVPITGKGELPATYVFETREGSQGVLQIVGFEEKPRGIKIRYKLIARKKQSP